MNSNLIKNKYRPSTSPDDAKYKHGWPIVLTSFQLALWQQSGPQV